LICVHRSIWVVPSNMAAVGDHIKEKKWDGDGIPVADSNMADVGSDEDKAVRKAAANSEPAWAGAGQAPGVQVWRIEQFQVVPYPKTSYGEFYSGDSYIVLHTFKDADSPKLIHNIHFWLGEKTTTDEMGTAAYKTVELDDLLDGEPTQHREVQGHESQQFRSLFPQLAYLEGGVATGFHHVAEGAYQCKLLRVRKTSTNGVRIKDVTLNRSSLNHGDCFILDTGTVIYVWEGAEASPLEKVAANEAAENIEGQRDGKAKATHDVDDGFWEHLGGEGDIAPASAATDKIPDRDPGEGVLYALSDTTGSLQTKEVARGDLGAGMLDTNNVMMLDTDAEIFLWVGAGASPGESRNSMATAMAYLKINNKPLHTPIHLYKEGTAIKNQTWNKTFASGPATAPKVSVAPAADPAPSLSRAGTVTPAPTASSDAAAGTMTLAELQDPSFWKPKGVDPQQRHVHLADDEFKTLFGVDKDGFAKFAKWKQDAEKKKHNLF